MVFDVDFHIVSSESEFCESTTKIVITKTDIVDINEDTTTI